MLKILVLITVLNLNLCKTQDNFSYLNYGELSDTLTSASQFYNPIYSPSQIQKVKTSPNSGISQVSSGSQPATSYTQFVTSAPSYNPYKTHPYNPYRYSYQTPSETVITPVQHSTVIHHTPYLSSISNPTPPYAAKLLHHVPVQPQPLPIQHYQQQHQQHPLEKQQKLQKIQKPVTYNNLQPSHQIFPHHLHPAAVQGHQGGSQGPFLPIKPPQGYAHVYHPQQQHHQQQIQQHQHPQRPENVRNSQNSEDAEDSEDSEEKQNEEEEKESENIEEENEDDEEREELNEDEENDDSNEEVNSRYRNNEEAAKEEDEEEEEEHPKYQSYFFNFNSPQKEKKRNKENQENQEEEEEDEEETRPNRPRQGYKTHEDVEEDDDEDANEDSTRNSPKLHYNPQNPRTIVKKVPKGFHKYDKYEKRLPEPKFDYERYTFTTPKPKVRHNLKNSRKEENKKFYNKHPKGHLKDAQGRYSQVVPVTTKHLYREKWYITKKI